MIWRSDIHIPGKINPADTITRQVRSEDQVYAGEVKQMDNELVDVTRTMAAH